MKQTIESNVLNFFVKKQKPENKIKTTQINQISSTFVCDSFDPKFSSLLKTFSSIEREQKLLFENNAEK